MKAFIYKINQYVLERFTTVWNTKLIWMVSISLLIHSVFYVLGFFSLTDVTLLHEYGAIDLFFENGTLFFSIIITIILLVIWLTQLFKNNSFKNFYPTSRLKLFSQFFQYFIIILLASTFYFSYIFGLKNYIDYNYPDEEFQTEIIIANNTALFLSHDLLDYTINNKKYPAPFDTIYCEKNQSLINTELAHLKYYDILYQFYTLKTKILDNTTSYNNEDYKGYAFYKNKDEKRIYYYKDSVVDIEKINFNVLPSYYNISNIFFDNGNDIDYSFNFELNSTDYRNENQKKKIERNKLNTDLLNRNNTKEIKELLSTFLGYCEKYEVKHNINTKQWFAIINQPSFNVKALIKEEKPTNRAIFLDEERTELEEYINSITTKYYIESDDLNSVFNNIQKIKNRKVFNEVTHVFVWLSFFLATLIFIFRVTNLRLFLFSIITSGVLFVFMSLAVVLYQYITLGNAETLYFRLYASLILGTVILLIPLIYYLKVKKVIVGICMNISIFGFVGFVLLIVGIISSHQSDYCRSMVSNYEVKECFILLQDLGLYWSVILLFIGFIFLYFYSAVIKRWRALEEQ